MSEKSEKPIQLDGKDYFTEKEAAHYACVSQTHFRARAAELGILPIIFMGKKVYRKADIQRSIEETAQWQHSSSVAGLGSSTGRRTAGRTGGR